MDGSVGRAGPKCADQEGHGRQQHHPATADQVGQTPRDEGTNGAAQQNGGDVNPRTERRQIERGFQPVLGTVDDAGVIAEHEAAERSHGDDQDYEPKIDAVRAGPGRSLSRC